MRNRFSLILFFYYSQFCILFSFAAVFFREQGYSGGRIGQLAAFSGLAVLAANPLAGRIADRYGEKKVVLLGLTVSAVMTVGLYFERKNYCGIFLFYGLVSIFNKSLAPQLDNWLYKYAVEHERVSYGSTRAVGSLGSALCAAGTGFLIDRMGFGTVFGVCVVFILTAQILVFGTARSKGPRKKSPGSKAGIKMPLKNKRYIILLVTTAVLFLGVTTEVTYYPVLFIDCGGNNRMLGLSLFLMSCSEMTGMALYRKFRARLQARQLLLLSMICYTVKITLQIFLSTMTGLILLQLIQALTYGLFLPSVVEMVSELVPEELSATGMGLCASCFCGVGVVLGNWLAAAVCERYGLRSAYFSASLLCILAVLIFLAGWKDKLLLKKQ